MNILNISKQDGEVVVILTADDLVKICNTLCNAPESDKNNIYYKLYGNMMLARDLCQYGHIDRFCFERIAECRSKIQGVENGY